MGFNSAFKGLIWENTDDMISYFLYTINILHTNMTGCKAGMT